MLLIYDDDDDDDGARRAACGSQCPWRTMLVRQSSAERYLKYQIGGRGPTGAPVALPPTAPAPAPAAAGVVEELGASHEPEAAMPAAVSSARSMSSGWK